MSPTLFFADARGLPFMEEDGEKYKAAPITSYPGNQPDRVYKKTIEDALKKVKEISIPKLHALMEERVDGYLMHDAIQSHNGSSPRRPKYGIDANRDYHSVLKSTEAFEKFIEKIRGMPDNITVLMLHGYDGTAVKEVEGEKSNSEGTIYGPYFVEDDKIYLTKKFMEDIDFITLYLFGYRYKKGNSNDKFQYSKNYLFDDNAATVSGASKYIGEWCRRLYDRDKINCYDIELGEDYREGTRGKTGTAGTSKRYDTNKVIKPDMPFFKDETKGKFVDINKNMIFKSEGETKAELPITLSFYDFLQYYYLNRNKIIDKVQ
jgi:hypothetical protein